MINDEVLFGRIPRIGSITTGYGVEATSRAGNLYARPTKSETLVLHTDDGEVATAVQNRFGGDVRQDSPNWDYDVVTDTRRIELEVLPGGWRQALETWRAGQCARRCDGVRMSTVDGRPVDRACVCEEEMARGAERTCTPTTVLPALLDLDVDRFGVWEIRSNGWGSASNLKGAMRALAMVGVTGGSVPAVLSMVDRTTRDADDQVREVVDLSLSIARSHRDLMAIGGPPANDPGELPAPPAADDPQQRETLLTRLADLQARAHRLGVRDRVKAEWRDRHGDLDVRDLSLAGLQEWSSMVTRMLADADQARLEEQAEAGGSP